MTDQERITALENQMVNLDEMTAFLAEQLVDISKKVNEGLMIANEYERKQKTLEREVKEFLDNISSDLE